MNARKCRYTKQKMNVIQWALVLWAGLCNNTGGRCLLSASLIKSKSPAPSTGPQSCERTDKGLEVGWNEMGKGKTLPLMLPCQSIDLTNWNGIEGETPDGSPLAWGGVLADSDRIPSETHCPWGPMLLPSFILQPLSCSYLQSTHSLGCDNSL